MENRIVGIIIIGIAALIGLIIFSFNRALISIVRAACEHGPTCPMWGTLNFHTYVSVGIMLFVGVIGLYMIFFGKEVKIVTKIKKIVPQIEPKKIAKESYQKAMSRQSADEKRVFKAIIEAEGTIPQSKLVEETNFTKVKVTRILDKLEGKGLIERKRRGMSNVVILRH